MSNINTYKNLGNYNGKGCEKKDFLTFEDKNKRWENRENFFSLSASVRRPFNQSYWDPSYVQPIMPGVN